jgi:hypothetical protein
MGLIDYSFVTVTTNASIQVLWTRKSVAKILIMNTLCAIFNYCRVTTAKICKRMIPECVKVFDL